MLHHLWYWFQKLFTEEMTSSTCHCALSGLHIFGKHAFLYHKHLRLLHFNSSVKRPTPSLSRASGVLQINIKMTWICLMEKEVHARLQLQFAKSNNKNLHLICNCVLLCNMPRGAILGYLVCVVSLRKSG